MKDTADRKKHFVYMGVAALACLQWALLRAAGFHFEPPFGALLPGLAILGAAFLLSWTAEAAELDLPQGLSVSLLALIAVLPEYAVDIYFAWTAGKDPAYISYATANMTGSNRLLIGVGWAAVLFAYWARHGKKEIILESGLSVELVALGAATLYAFIPTYLGTLSLIDCAVFLMIFALYAWRTAQAEVGEPELEGPALTIGSLPRTPRRVVVTVLFLFSALAIYLAAEPFAEGLLAAGKQWGMDEFFLVQWLAPLASEAPEFIVAVLFALKGKGEVGLRVLVSSKVNQWTLLVGMLPAAFCLSGGSLSPMPLDSRQVHELLLTAAQSFFAITILINLRFSLKEAALLAVLFLTQPFFTSAHARNLYSAVYIVAGIAVLAFPGTRRHLRDALSTAFRT